MTGVLLKHFQTTGAIVLCRHGPLRQRCVYVQDSAIVVLMELLCQIGDSRFIVLHRSPLHAGVWIVLYHNLRQLCILSCLGYAFLLQRRLARASEAPPSQRHCVTHLERLGNGWACYAGHGAHDVYASLRRRVYLVHLDVVTVRLLCLLHSSL